jgi:hypothetical protein
MVEVALVGRGCCGCRSEALVGREFDYHRNIDALGGV